MNDINDTESGSPSDEFLEGQNTYSGDDVEQEDEELAIDLSQQKPRAEWKDKTDYTFYVESYEVGPSKNSGREQITWKFKCPDVNNFTLKHYTGLDDAGLWATEEVLVALGLAKKGEAIKLSKRKTIGRRLIGTVVLEEYEGRMSAKIKKIKPHKDGPVSDNPF